MSVRGAGAGVGVGVGVGVAVGVGVGAAGVAATYHGEAPGPAGPPPVPFTARTLNRYSVPLVSPVTVNDVVSQPLPVTAVHAPQPGAGGAARCLYS